MKIAIVIGTRPEAIKLAPVISALRQERLLEPLIVSTGQHRQMLDQAFTWFGVNPDLDLKLMRPSQTLNELFSLAVTRLDEVLLAERPAVVLVQGDTTTALAAAIAAFHCKIPVGHVEAGLRTYDLAAPFPEEANRNMISRISRWHFAPTERSAQALKEERAPGEIFMTGNTVVDALLYTAALTGEPSLTLSGERLVLITGHRRENIGPRFQEVFEAIGILAERFPNVDFVYPVHMNPAVHDHAHGILRSRPNVKLTEPVPYPELICLLKRAYLVLTDSGGIQEEAPSFGVPVLVMRDTTERPEAIEAGVAHLVGTDRDSIVSAASDLLNDPGKRAAQSRVTNPFGDGQAAARIVGYPRHALINDPPL